MLIGFDIDDTILDHAGAMRAAAITFYEAHRSGLGDFASAEAFAQRWHELGELHMGRYLRKEVSFPEQRRARIRALFGAGIEDQRADRMFEGYLLHYAANWRLFSDVVPVLEALRPLAPLVAITNGEPTIQREKLRVLGVDRDFDALITPEDAGFAKPDPRIFRITSERHGVSPELCIYVGNDLAIDAEAARAAGWIGVWLNRGVIDGRNRSVLEVPTLAALPGIVRDVHALRSSVGSEA